MATETYRADDVRPLLLSGHIIRRPPRTEGAHFLPHAHVRDEDGGLVGRVHENILRMLEDHGVLRRIRADGVIEWVLR